MTRWACLKVAAEIVALLVEPRERRSRIVAPIPPVPEVSLDGGEHALRVAGVSGDVGRLEPELLRLVGFAERIQGMPQRREHSVAQIGIVRHSREAVESRS